MMAAIIKELTIAVEPERVFNALTLQDGVAHWWTDDLSIKPEIGSLAEFRFTQGRAGILQFEVVELDAGENVSWISRKGPASWAETNITWRLTTVQSGTNLVFTHEGFAQTNEAYERTRKYWEYFLASLKAYLETGKGTPGMPPPSR